MTTISPGVGFFSTVIGLRREEWCRTGHWRGEAHHLVPASARSRGSRRGSGNLPDVRRIGVLASGSGTILESLITAALPIGVVVVDRLCRAVDVAEGAGIPVELVERETFGPDFDRLAYTERLVDALKRHEIDLVTMAGFMTIMEHPNHDAYRGRIT